MIAFFEKNISPFFLTEAQTPMASDSADEECDQDTEGFFLPKRMPQPNVSKQVIG